MESGDGMKRWKQSLNDPRRIIEHPHGDWVRYDDIPFHPDIAETEKERRQEEMIGKQVDIIAKQHRQIRDFEVVLTRVREAEMTDHNLMDCVDWAREVLKVQDVEL